MRVYAGVTKPFLSLLQSTSRKSFVFSLPLRDIPRIRKIDPDGNVR